MGDRAELACYGEGVLGDLALFGGRTEEAVARWAAAEGGYAAGQPGLTAWAIAVSALALVYGGRPVEAAARAAEAVAVADRSGCGTVRA
ncbi:MAG: hypothetical protein ACRD2W_07365, partial [Acidimicrobiales bacterium]